LEWSFENIDGVRVADRRSCPSLMYPKEWISSRSRWKTITEFPHSY